MPLHIAETREEAYRDAREGFGAWLHGYWGEAVGADVLAGLDGVPESRHLEATVEQGRAVVGSVEDAVEAIRHLQETTGGFGTFLTYVVNWASFEKVKRSFELLATEVAPRFTGSADRGLESVRWSTDNRALFPHTEPLRAPRRGHPLTPATHDGPLPSLPPLPAPGVPAPPARRARPRHGIPNSRFRSGGGGAYRVPGLPMPFSRGILLVVPIALMATGSVRSPL